MQWADTMQELNERRLNGEFESEEAYNQAVLAAKDYFYKQLDDYSYLYGVAVSEDTRVAADAWSTEFSSMVTDTDSWKTNVSNYISEVQGAFSTWDTSMSSLYGENGTLSQIETKVKDIKDAASALKTLLIGDTETGTKGIVDDAATASANALALATDYATVRNTIVGEGGLIEAYETQLEEITTLIDNLSNLDNTSINVHQTLTAETKLDASDFHAAVRDFSAAIGGFNPESPKEDYRIGSLVSNKADSNGSIGTFVQGSDGKLSKTSYGSVDAADIVGSEVKDVQTQNDETFLKIQTRSGDFYWIKESAINYASELIGQTLKGFTKSKDYKWQKSSTGTMEHSGEMATSQEVKGAKIVDVYAKDDGLWVKLDAGYWVWYKTIDLNNTNLDYDHSTYGIPGMPQRTAALLQPYDTGGYTGEWGPDGKLAILHEKELILNAEDTSNFLSALDLLDNILLTLDKHSVNAQLSGLLSSPAFSMNNQDTLEQNVHIEASFPNVEDRNEIEEALNNLINRASQYASPK